ncbi:MAG: DEAD/DEAH box helicase family protein, partial [Desulfoferrobacter sp.]
MITVNVTSKTFVHLHQKIPLELAKQIRERLTFQNPKWIENEKHGFSNWDTPKELCYLRKERNSLAVPRGFTRQLIGILKNSGVQYRVDDQRRTLPEVDYTFTGRLRDYQNEAVKAILKRDFDTLSAPTGSGKTVIGLAIIALRKQPALVIVHTNELLNQW